MDFGLVGLDGLVGSAETGLASSSLTSSDPETKHKWYGSGLLKQERPDNTGEDDWRSLKVAKTDHDFSVSKALLHQQRNTTNPTSLRSNNYSLISEGQQHQHQHQQQQMMLSFSSPKSEALLVRNGSTGATFPYYHHTQSACNRNTGT